MIEALSLHKEFEEGERKISVLAGLDLKLEPKQKLGIVGASGTGKSTLLHILGGLDLPTAGEVLIGGEDLYRMDEAKRSGLRNRFFGFVFQFYHLLPELTVLENASLPAQIAGLSKKEALRMGQTALERVGLAKRTSLLPLKLSGGEQQRVALARALCLKPKLILADEPTGNLDQETGQDMMRYLLEVVQESEGSLILVTHNRDLTKDMDEVMELRDGKLHKI